MKALTTWTIVALALVGMSGVFGGWVYVYSMTRTALQNRDRAVQELEQLSGQDEHTRALSILIRDTKEQREELKALVFNTELLDAIQMIEESAAAAGAGVTVTFIGQGEQQTGSILAVAPIILELSGSFRNIFGAVTLLETTPHLASISQMRIEQTPEGNDAWLATVRLDVGYTAERKQEDQPAIVPPGEPTQDL